MSLCRSWAIRQVVMFLCSDQSCTTGVNEVRLWICSQRTSLSAKLISISWTTYIKIYSWKPSLLNSLVLLFPTLFLSSYPVCTYIYIYTRTVPCTQQLLYTNYKGTKAYPVAAEEFGCRLLSLFILGKPFFQRLITWPSLDPCPEIVGF